jgi:hypothetical protein
VVVVAFDRAGRVKGGRIGGHGELEHTAQMPAPAKWFNGQPASALARGAAKVLSHRSRRLPALEYVTAIP